MTNHKQISLLRSLVIAANILFILWMTWNGIDEGFGGTIYQKMSYVGLTVLLIFNIILIIKKSPPK